MGGLAENFLSGHRKEDRAFHDKRRELRALMPELNNRLEEMRECTSFVTSFYYYLRIKVLLLLLFTPVIYKK